MQEQSTTDSKTTQLDIFLKMLRDHGDSDECLLWPFGLVRGYGRVWFHGRPWFVHRLAYLTFNGDIPDNHDILHSCDVKNCFSPSHLSSGTDADNVHDREAKRRMFGRNYFRLRAVKPAEIKPIREYRNLRTSPFRSMKAIKLLIAEHGDRTDCLNWPFHVNGSGYGIVMINGKMRRVHRVAYALQFGEPPADLVVMHDCDNRRCLAWRHLKVGTRGDNYRDCHAKGRASGPKGESNHLSVFTKEQVLEIRSLYNTGAHSFATLAKLFKCSRGGIGSVVTRKTWKHI